MLFFHYSSAFNKENGTEFPIEVNAWQQVFVYVVVVVVIICDLILYSQNLFYNMTNIIVHVYKEFK